jgi:hypothetical protein
MSQIIASLQLKNIILFQKTFEQTVVTGGVCDMIHP